MQVEGTLHLWTTMLGWYDYNVVWGLLRSTGIAVVPIIGMILDHFLSVRSAGSAARVDGDRALAGLEVQIGTAVMVILIAVQPSPLTSLSASTFRYTPVPSAFSDDVTARTLATTTNTNYDGVLASAEHDIINGSVNVPILWFIVMQAAQGFRHALVNNADTRGQVYRAMRDIANRAAIKNPELRLAVDDFNAECYTRALSRYRRQGDGNPTVRPPTAGTEDIGVDIGWMGSKTFQNEIYPTLRVRHIVNGFAYDSDIDVAYTTDPGAGAPTCQKYWTEKIRPAIRAEADADGFVTTWARAGNFVKAAAAGTFDITGADFDDRVARHYLQNTEMKLSMSADQINAIRTRDSGWMTGVIRKGAGLLQSYELGKMAAAVELGVDAIIHALIAGQAYALKILYMAMPLVFVFSRYSLPAVSTVMVMVFTLHLLPVVWAGVAWLDANMGNALWKGEGFFGTLTSDGPEALKARLIHSLTIAGLYLSSAAFFTVVLAASGIRGAYAVAGMGRAIQGSPIPPTSPIIPPSVSASASRASIGHGTGAATRAVVGVAGRAGSQASNFVRGR